MAESRNGFAGRCGYCGARLEAKTTRRRFCNDACRWAAWKRRREEEARAPVERALRVLVARADDLAEAAEEAREVLGEQEAERGIEKAQRLLRRQIS